MHAQLRSQSPQEDSSMIGIGLYTAAEASAYTGVPSRDITRWLFGYTGDKKRRNPGLWTPELADHTDLKALGFHDLLEIRFVHAFRKFGVSLQAIRVASQHAREIFHQNYPFTSARFRTDGRSIFASVLEETGDESLIDLVKRQLAFKQVIAPSLYEGIEYDRSGEADRWFPLHRSKAVVLDPDRQFGKPIVTDAGIRTATLVDAWQAEGKNPRRVAAIYEIPVTDVEAALRFERKGLT